MTSEHPRIVSDSGTNTPSAPDMARRATGAGAAGGGSSGTFSVKTGLAQVCALLRARGTRERCGRDATPRQGEAAASSAAWEACDAAFLPSTVPAPIRLRTLCGMTPAAS